MWDQHMHCMFSGDSDADPVLMINQQSTKGWTASALQTIWTMTIKRSPDFSTLI